MVLRRVVVGILNTNCYILGSRKSREAVIIDPGGDFPKIINVVRRYNLVVKFVINTHAHEDHIAENDKFKVPILIHKDDAGALGSSSCRVLNDGDKVTVGEITLEVIHTPGHTPGSICLRTERDFTPPFLPSVAANIERAGFIFTGDTLFSGGIGRTDFPFSSEELLRKSIIENLFTLNDEMVIYPGHGPPSTIGKEKEKNPFL